MHTRWPRVRSIGWDSVQLEPVSACSSIVSCWWIARWICSAQCCFDRAYWFVAFFFFLFFFFAYKVRTLFRYVEHFQFSLCTYFHLYNLQSTKWISMISRIKRFRCALEVTPRMHHRLLGISVYLACLVSSILQSFGKVSIFINTYLDLWSALHAKIVRSFSISQYESVYRGSSFFVRTGKRHLRSTKWIRFEDRQEISLPSAFVIFCTFGSSCFSILRILRSFEMSTSHSLRGWTRSCIKRILFSEMPRLNIEKNGTRACWDARVRAQSCLLAPRLVLPLAQGRSRQLKRSILLTGPYRRFSFIEIPSSDFRLSIIPPRSPPRHSPPRSFPLFLFSPLPSPPRQRAFLNHCRHSCKCNMSPWLKSKNFHPSVIEGKHYILLTVAWSRANVRNCPTIYRKFEENTTRSTKILKVWSSVEVSLSNYL